MTAMTLIEEPGSGCGHVRDAVARAVEQTIEPAARDVDKRGRFPRAGLDALAGAGVLGATVARGLGGGGLWLREAAAIVRRVAASCASTATVLQAHFTAVAMLEEHAPVGLRKEIAAGRHLLTTALDLLGDDGALRIRGPVADLYGNRAWVPAAGEADSYVWSCGRHLCLVPATAPGLHVPAGEEAIGLRGTATAPLVADPVSVPAEAVLTDEAPRVLREVAFPWFVVLGAAVSLGIMDRTIAATAAAVGRCERRPGLLAELARMRVRADSVRGMFAQTLDAVLWQRGDGETGLLALRAATVQTAIGVTDLAMKVCQVATASGAPEVERRFRDARAAYAIPPTPDAALERLGTALYGGD